MKRNKIFNSLIATAAFTGILTAGFPKVALSATNILNVCKESNSLDSDYIVYLESGDETLRITTPKDSNGFNRQIVKETLQTDYEYTESEANTVKSNLVSYDRITGVPICYTSNSSSSSNGVQGIELRYLDSAFQCGSDTRQANIKVDVYNRRNYTKLATLSKLDTEDTYTTSSIDSINDLVFVYKIYNFTHCRGFTQGIVRNARDSMVLGTSDTIPDTAGFEDQASVREMLEGLDSYEKLLLVELGSNDTSSASYDLQDVVLVVDNNPDSIVNAQETDEDNDTLRPVLWGIDEDDGQLFAMQDYTQSSTMVNYGKLKWNDNGTIRNINADMEAMTLDENGDMYIALDRKLSGTGRGATLLKFNINDASTTENNVVQVVGEIGIDFDNNNDNVSGLSIDPNTGQLVALLKNNGGSATDKLYIINKGNGNVVREIGSIQGLSERSTKAEDIEHAPDGSLYVTDNADDHTYKVNALTGAIIQIVDNNQKGGLGSDSAKFEALGWDFANNRLIGFDDDRESLAKLTLGDGDNQEYYQTRSMGLTDVEGVDFVPTLDGQPTAFLDYDNDGVPDPDPDSNPNPNPDPDPDPDPDPELDSDADNNGILDRNELPGDVDIDGIANKDDLDDDGDNIPDVMELHTPSAIASTGTKVMTHTLRDGTTISVILPNPPETSILHTDAINSDGSDLPDYQDIDSDNDYISDKDEAGDTNLATVPSDKDSDGTPNYLDQDSDNDFISDRIESGKTASDDIEGVAPVNTDRNFTISDDIPDYLDYDSDGDFISDRIESGKTALNIDDTITSFRNTDANIPGGDNVPDHLDQDSDADNISDRDESGKTALNISDTISSFRNTDAYIEGGDDLPDYLDQNSDADKYTDKQEAGDDDLDTYPVNSDSSISDDSIADFRDLDSDDNGILDSDEVDTDIDGDELYNFQDLDDDGDRIVDIIEIGGGDTPLNSDNADDADDYQDTDSDNDGILDEDEGIKTSTTRTTTVSVTYPNFQTSDYQLQDGNLSDTEKDGDSCIDEDENTSDCSITVTPTVYEDGTVSEDGTVYIEGTITGLDYQTKNFAD